MAININSLVIITGLLFIIAIGFTIFYVNRASKQTRITLNSLGETLNQGIEDINSGLEPLKIAVSRSMGIIGEKGHDTQKLKRAEKYIAQDLIDSQDPLILAALDALSPNGKARGYLEENPDLILQLLPRLQALSKIEGFNPIDLIKKSGESSPWANHPLRNSGES